MNCKWFKEKFQALRQVIDWIAYSFISNANIYEIWHKPTVLVATTFFLINKIWSFSLAYITNNI